MKPNVILASTSAIRREILEQAAIDFTVLAKPIDEASLKIALLDQGESAANIADALAEAKSRRVSMLNEGLVIGADQVMVMDDTLYDKPTSIDEARTRLLSMRGRSHDLIGAIVICENGEPVWRNLSRTRLTMRNFSENFLETYLELEKDAVTKSVGAYRFEGPGAQLFSKVDGDFFSVLGLDLLPLLDFLRLRGAILS